MTFVVGEAPGPLLAFTYQWCGLSQCTYIHLPKEVLTPPLPPGHPRVRTAQVLCASLSELWARWLPSLSLPALPH